jgi:transcriptional regulator with XRE-family HTH domain
LISRLNLLQRLRRSKEARARFVESHLDKSIAFQIRSLRDKEQWTQAEFAQKLGIKHQNNVSARLENPNYGKHSLSTLKKIAATCDVALVVWFIPFSRLLDWVTGNPYLDNGLSGGFYNIPTFNNEFGDHVRAIGPMPKEPLNQSTPQLRRPPRFELGSIEEAQLA